MEASELAETLNAVAAEGDLDDAIRVVEERAADVFGREVAASILALLKTLRERQRLLERLSRIQRKIVSRSELEEVLEAIVWGARELLGDETVGLRLLDLGDR
ncbi:MAG: hypothetical protein WKF62_06170, partial [Solirubrobacterales bacterium]